FTTRGQPQLVTMSLAGAVGLPKLETDINYDAFGRVLSRKDRQTGAEQTFQYDGIGRVLQRSTRAAPSPDEVWDYVYQPGKNELLIRETLASELYTRETHSIDGLRESESWNFAGGKATRTFTAYSGGKLTEMTDERSVKHQYSYDEEGRFIEESVSVV